jgi:bacillithiol system protein YtxJ
MSQVNFQPVQELSAADELLSRSHTAPVVVFKHSVTCSISADVYREVAGYNGDIALVVVQTARPLSNEIAARTGIRHESPQAIVLRNGRAVWHQSHYDITAEGVQKAVEENQ